MFSGVQKLYGPLAGIVVAIVSMVLLGGDGPTQDQIDALNVEVSTFISLLIGTAVNMVVTYLKANINVNGIVMRFVSNDGTIEDAGGKPIGKISNTVRNY